MKIEIEVPDDLVDAVYDFFATLETGDYSLAQSKRIAAIRLRTLHESAESKAHEIERAAKLVFDQLLKQTEAAQRRAWMVVR